MLGWGLWLRFRTRRALSTPTKFVTVRLHLADPVLGAVQLCGQVGRAATGMGQGEQGLGATLLRLWGPSVLRVESLVANSQFSVQAHNNHAMIFEIIELRIYFFSG